MSKPIVLENETFRAVFSETTGALLALEHKSTQWQVQHRPELALSFRLLVPLPQRRNNPVLGVKQTLHSHTLSEDGKKATFVWRDLRSEFGGTLDITVTGTVTLGAEGLTFEATVENRCPHVVENLYYPCIGDLVRPPGAETFDHMHQHYSTMLRHGIYPNFVNHRGYYGTDYPIQISVPPDAAFALLAAPLAGLYVGCHDVSAREHAQFMLEQKPGWEDSLTTRVPAGETISQHPVHTEFSVVHFPYANPGETITVSPIQVTPYSGTWHKGADCYKRWRATWFKAPPTPAWCQEVHSWQQIHINSPEDELRCRYSDLVKYGEDCAKHGVAAIQLVGWNDGGQDRGNPSHEIDPRLGTWEELREAIERIQAIGVKLILFSKFTWADRSQEWFRKELNQYACRDPYGDYFVYMGYQYQTPAQLSDINTRRLIPMCHHSAVWREIANKEFRKLLKLGAAGMLFDECQHHGGARYCFGADHGHHVPAHIFAGDAKLERGFKEISDAEAPDFLYAGESPWDYQFLNYHLSYFRIWPGQLDHVPLARYLAPHQAMMVAVTGYNDRNMINQCLLWRYIMSYEPLNFKGRLDEFPLTMEYGKKVDALRRQYREYLWDAEYRDSQDAQVTVEGKPHRWYSVFRQEKTGKRAVVIANCDAKKSIEATVMLEGGGGRCVLATPERPDAVAFSGSVQIEPESAAVVMEQ